VHQQWQTDFTYFKIIGWGWYYLATVMDDYSRYIITWELCKNMETDDAKRVVRVAIEESGIDQEQRPRLLTDNGSCYISKEFKKFIEDEDPGHVQGAPYHPQTQGKIERYHRTMNNVVKLENYFFPDELRTAIELFVDYYNNERYHESLGNLIPADVYSGRDRKVRAHRHQIKMITLKERMKINGKLSA
jgi:putative transposase